MTITITNLITPAGSNTDAVSYAAASLGSVAGGTYLVAIVTNGVATQPAEQITTITGTLGAQITMAEEGTALLNSSLVGRLSIWMGLVPTTLSGNLTFNFGAGNTQSNCQWQILGLTSNVGTIAVTNVETQQTASANPSMTISPSPPAGSTVIGGMTANGTTAAVQGSGWTLNNAGTSQTSPALRTAVQYDNSNPGATFNWTQASAFNRCQVAITLEETAPSGLPYNIITGGAKKTAVSDAVIIGGAKKTVVNRWVIVGGAKKTLV